MGARGARLLSPRSRRPRPAQPLRTGRTITTETPARASRSRPPGQLTKFRTSARKRCPASRLCPDPSRVKRPISPPKWRPLGLICTDKALTRNYRLIETFGIDGVEVWGALVRAVLLDARRLSRSRLYRRTAPDVHVPDDLREPRPPTGCGSDRCWISRTPDPLKSDRHLWWRQHGSAPGAGAAGGGPRVEQAYSAKPRFGLQAIPGEGAKAFPPARTTCP